MPTSMFQGLNSPSDLVTSRWQVPARHVKGQSNPYLAVELSNNEPEPIAHLDQSRGVYNIVHCTF